MLRRPQRRTPIDWTLRLLVTAIIANTIADLIPYYFKETNQGGVGVIGYVRAAILAVIALHFWTRFRSLLWLRSATAKWILVLLTYFGVLASLTANVPYSMSVYLKVFFSMLMFIFARRAVRSAEDLAVLSRAVIASLAIIVTQFALAQAFQLGLDNSYVSGTFYWGGGAPEAMSRAIAYSLLAGPLSLLLFQRRRARVLAGFVYVVSALVLILLFNRTAFLALTLGYLTLFCFEQSRKRLAAYAVTAATVFLITLPYYQSAFTDLLVARYRHTMESFEEEARWTETGYVFEELVTKNAKHVLFGSELFNSPQYFYENLYFPVKRQLHVDYNKVLHGSGVVGLTLFLGMYLALMHDLRRALRPLVRWPGTPTVRATFGALMVASLTLSVGSDMEYVGARSILFMYLGGLIGVADATARQFKLASLPLVHSTRAPLPDRRAVAAAGA